MPSARIAGVLSTWISCCSSSSTASASSSGARYAALGIIGRRGLHRAVHHERHHGRDSGPLLGRHPAGHGLLGLIIREGRSLRIPDIAGHPASYGFPPNHPPMTRCSASRCALKGRRRQPVPDRQGRRAPSSARTTSGWSRCSRCTPGSPSRTPGSTRQVQRLAVVDERERIGQDLHDGIIQSIYARRPVARGRRRS